MSLPPQLFRLIVPDDPFGKSNRYRQIRLLLETEGRYRHSFGSIVQPISRCRSACHGATVDQFGLARATEGRLALFREDSLEGIAPERREKVHASLHPSGVCHVRAQFGQPIATHDLSGWYPLATPFTWLHAFSEPVGSLPLEPNRRKRDALATFPNLEKSTYVRVDLLPANPAGEYEYAAYAIETLINLGSEFVGRCTVAEHNPISAGLAIAITKPLSLDPL